MFQFNQLTAAKLDLVYLAKITAALLKKLKIRGELSITFGPPRLLQKLNKQFRGQNVPTDVLSFYLGAPDMWGEIVIAPKLAAANARQYQNTLSAEIIYLIVHALCHLQGHDHSKASDTGRMRRAENRLLAYLKKTYNINIVGRI